ncbi:MAG: HD domain-containing phosphohydrolase [Solirubrobacteraceae bacterium]
MANGDPRAGASPAGLLRAAEIVGAISLATDLGTGQPLEHALRTAILAGRLGELAEASQQDRSDAYYVALLHSFGCTSDATEVTELYGDDIAPRAAFALVDAGNPEEVGAYLATHVGRGREPEVRDAMVAHALEHGLELAQETFALHCEVAQRFAGWLGLSAGTHEALAFVFERWDGHGFPGLARGEQITLPARLLHVARDISVFVSASGADEARAVIDRRAGAAYDPALAALALEHFDELLSGLDEARIWDQAIAAEPPPLRWIAGEEIDAAFGVVATFTNLKSRWLRGHAEGVAALAEAAAWRLELAPDEVGRVRHAALSLDLGRVGVSNAIWEKPGPLGLGDWERVQLHPYFTERAFAHAESLAPIGALAGAHHERLDGSGYHRQARAPGIDRAARILAAADAYQAMREPRPHRPARDAAEAQAELQREADAGRLCPQAVDAVLAAAGHRVPKRPRELPGGLTARELEVLLALVDGLSNSQIGERLGISPKTAGHHVQHIYEKAGVRSRTAAAVWAYQHSLVQAE